jgi:Ca-activated chloride channel family protein
VYQLEYPWLLAVLPLPILVWLLMPAYRERSQALRIAFFTDVARVAGLKPAPGAVVLRTNWLQRILAPLVWALIVVGLARPQYVEPPLTQTVPARDLLLAIDLSQSMDAKDFHDPAGALEPRAQAVRRVVDEFITRRSGDRIALVAFGDAPYPLVPFTLDHATVRAMLADSRPGMAGPRTALGDAIGLAIKMFDNSQAPDKVMILLSDGNDTASRMPPKRAAAIAKDRRVRIHTIGIGDPKGDGEDRLDQEGLRAIAETTGGRFFFGGDQRELAASYATLDAITPANQKTLTWRPTRELSWYFVGAGVLLLAAYELLMAIWSVLRRARASRSIDRPISDAA